jgi:6-phosphogluconolactonase (cycloisomerase 2 family)
MKFPILSIAALSLAACNSDGTTAPVSADPALNRGGNSSDVGVVLALGNQTSGNEVLVYRRHADGSLTQSASVSANGTGTGTGLGSQGALAYSPDGSLLFVVNAGSNTVTSFRVHSDELTRVSTVSSGGVQPISLTASNGLLYVLNAGGTGNISGLRYDANGTLTPIAGSTRALSSSNSAPAQIEFTPSGNRLVVTEKAANIIGTYDVPASGVAAAGLFTPSSGMTPFGFAFRDDVLIVSEAFGGAPNLSVVSSYRVGNSGAPAVISASVPTTETAACWVAVTGNGRFAYATNTGSGTISGFSVSTDGELTPLDANGETAVLGTGTAPADLAFSKNSRFLYARNGGTRTISILQVKGGDGSLTVVGTVTGLPSGAAGLVAR